MELTHIATREGRLSSFLRGEMQMSAGLMNKLKWGDSIRVNGASQHTDFFVRCGDVITVIMQEQTPVYPAEPGELTILYEDDHILAVDKPSGMLIHPSHSCNTGTLANRVLWYFQQTGQQMCFHPLTRLDRDTFGVVLLAKNPHIHHLLQAGAIKKTYHAITFGAPEKDAGIIDAPIARKPLPSLLREIRQDGKPSVTEYRVLERKGMLCKLELRPIAPTAASRFWVTLSTEHRGPRYILSNGELPLSCCAPKSWNLSIPCPQCLCAFSPIWMLKSKLQ